MSYKKLALTTLTVNSANDRHGELENESSDISWLFANHETYSRNLAKDLVSTGEVYEPPSCCPMDRLLPSLMATAASHA